MAINFPNSPTIGDEFTGGGFTWTWTGSAWEKVEVSSSSLSGFLVDLGDYTNNTAELDEVYPAGSYAITVDPADTTIDIYFIAEDGTSAGYSNTESIVAAEPFKKVVVLGASSGKKISFAYSGSRSLATTKGAEVGAGAFITSIGTASLPNIDDTTTITGGNFATNVEVSVIGQNTIETLAKSVVRNSSTELIMTRPDSFSPTNSPYTVKVINPGIPAATGSNAHLLSNALTAGTNPVWTTGTNIYYNVGGPTSITLLATDTEATDIDYTVVSGTLPAGLTLNNESGVISGSFSGTASANDSTAITFRATDSGGNFLDKTINMIANTAPTWVTASPLYFIPSQPTSKQLVATSAVVANTRTFSIVSGSLLSGISLNSAGQFSGTNTAANGSSTTVTIRVTDNNGLYTDRTFTLNSSAPLSGGTLTVSGGYAYHTFTSSGTLTVNAATPIEYLVVGGGGYGGSYTDQGGGGGGIYANTMTTSVGTMPVTVGGQNGGTSTFNGKNATGGNKASGAGDPGGIISSISYQPGVNTYGSGSGNGNGGGGGAGQKGQDMTYRFGGNGGNGLQWVNGQWYGGGGGGGSSWSDGYMGFGGEGGGGGYNGAAVANTGGGGATRDLVRNPGPNGATGVVIVRYPA